MSDKEIIAPISTSGSFTNAVTGRSVKISVIGVGGCGGNIINSICLENLGIKTIALNTDSQAIKNSMADVAVVVGKKKTAGLGAGANIEVGEAAVRENMEEILDLVKGDDMVFIIAGMGGGTGTKGSSIIAEALKATETSVVSFATLPFFFEGQGRLKKAQYGVSQLKASSDALICVNNQKLISKLKGKNLGIKEGFRIIDKVLVSGIKTILRLISEEQDINVDFADIKTTLSKGGSVVIGEAEAFGDNRSSLVVESLFANELSGMGPIETAKAAILSISGPSDLGFEEAAAAADAIHRKMGGGEIEVIFGMNVCPEMKKGTMKAAVIAAGLEDGLVTEGVLSNALSYIHGVGRLSSGAE